ncbi:MAG: DUF2442 domain-containing protein [Chloroflexi bacterium]|nr:DUF2442 domain-containing protein [Chloroflexota bacterium]
MKDPKLYHFVRPTAVNIQDGKLRVTLEDERTISTPLRWYPWLENATPEQQNTVELLPDAIYWPELDEGLEVEGMLRGIRPAPNAHERLIT